MKGKPFEYVEEDHLKLFRGEAIQRVSDSFDVRRVRARVAGIDELGKVADVRRTPTSHPKGFIPGRAEEVYLWLAKVGARCCKLNEEVLQGVLCERAVLRDRCHIRQETGSPAVKEPGKIALLHSEKTSGGLRFV